MKKIKYNTAKEITDEFIKDGWSNTTSFSELSLEEARVQGYLFAVIGISRGRKYFRMNNSGNIYNDEGKICMHNVPVQKPLSQIENPVQLYRDRNGKLYTLEEVKDYWGRCTFVCYNDRDFYEWLENQTIFEEQ